MEELELTPKPRHPAIRRFRKKVKTAWTSVGKRVPIAMSLLNRYTYRTGSHRYKKYLKLPVDEKLIVFDAFMGRQFACSPKAVYLELLKDERFRDFTFVWAFKKPKRFGYMLDYPNTLAVRYNSQVYFSYCAQAKYWITNSRLNPVIKKKDEQIYIQCWHGTPLKKLGFDIDVKGENALNTKDELLKKYKMDSDRYTYMIAPSAFAAEKFASAFDLPDSSIIKTIGYPRNDFLYNYTQEDVEAIRKKLSITNLLNERRFSDIRQIKEKFDMIGDKKVILYAPTWRDNQHNAGEGFTYELGVDFARLMEEFGDEYIILFRAHYFIANSIDLSAYEGFVYDVSRYNDINELYVMSDILITDYSSVFFDFANLKRPMLFYMYDFEEYKNEMRDFYIDIDELPGPIVKTEDDLIEAIRQIGSYEERYAEKYARFNERFTSLDDGKASQRLIEACIIPHM